MKTCIRFMGLCHPGFGIRAGCAAAKAQKAFKPVPGTPPALKANHLHAGQIDLGRMLFFDPRLSSSWLISCNTCHNLSLGESTR